MRATPSVVFGLVSLVCSANATRQADEPVLAKRQTVTASSDGCTAVCHEPNFFEEGIQCSVSCDEPSVTTVPATSTSTLTSTRTSARTSTRTPSRTSTRTPSRTSTRKSTRTSTVIKTVTSKPKAALTQQSVVSNTNGPCHETCSINEEEGDFDCDFTCDLAAMVTLTPIRVTDAVQHKRTVVSAVKDDCTAICWDLMPGTECDIQCKSGSKTQMPVTSEAARIAHREARENVQGMPIRIISYGPSLTYKAANQAQEARLARKFSDLAALDDSRSYRYVTVISVENPAILPVKVPRAAEPSLMSHASAAISAAQQALPALVATESSDASKESLFLSIFGPALSSLSAASAAPVSTSSATATTTSTALKTTTELAIPSKTTTTTSTTLETTTASVDEPETTTTTSTSSKTTTETKTPVSIKTVTASASAETVTDSVDESETTTTTKIRTSIKTVTASVSAETATDSVDESETTTTTKTRTSMKTVTASASASETATESTTTSATTTQTTTESSTSSETVTESTTTTESSREVVTPTTLATAYIGKGTAHQNTVSSGLVLFLSFWVGLAVNVHFLI